MKRIIWLHRALSAMAFQEGELPDVQELHQTIYDGSCTYECRCSSQVQNFEVYQNYLGHVNDVTWATRYGVLPLWCSRCTTWLCIYSKHTWIIKVKINYQKIESWTSIGLDELLKCLFVLDNLFLPSTLTVKAYAQSFHMTTCNDCMLLENEDLST